MNCKCLFCVSNTENLMSCVQPSKFPPSCVQPRLQWWRMCTVAIKMRPRGHPRMTMRHLRLPHPLLRRLGLLALKAGPSLLATPQRLLNQSLPRMRQKLQTLREQVRHSRQRLYRQEARKSESDLASPQSNSCSWSVFLPQTEVQPLHAARKLVTCSVCMNVKHKYGFKTG